MRSFNTDIQQCCEVMRHGGIILYPTDTVWGIGCDATNEAAVNKIFSVKKRNEEKSMIILVAAEKDILHYTDHPNAVVFDYIKGIHKPTTIIYEGAKNLAPNLVNSDGSVGIRLVKDEFCIALINAFGKPIVSTSSNISGYPAPSFFQDIDLEIKNGVDYIVQHRQDDFTPASPSTVIKLDRDGNITVIRP
ncbi:MAG: threonylcarbamoyl-AMP synthase [Chitinophagaceae bacterium]|nr:MAG: threonylcarbamoyl-AMP synthase [Chitinophagaceae bacterium]